MGKEGDGSREFRISPSLNTPLLFARSGSDGLSGQLKGLQKNLDDWKQKERTYQEKINDEAKELEKISSKQGLLLKKKDEAMKKIRDLGSLPSDAFDKYQVRWAEFGVHGERFLSGFKNSLLL